MASAVDEHDKLVAEREPIVAQQDAAEQKIVAEHEEIVAEDSTEEAIAAEHEEIVAEQEAIVAEHEPIVAEDSTIEAVLAEIKNRGIVAIVAEEAVVAEQEAAAQKAFDEATKRKAAAIDKMGAEEQAVETVLLQQAEEGAAKRDSLWQRAQSCHKLEAARKEAESIVAEQENALAEQENVAEQLCPNGELAVSSPGLAVLSPASQQASWLQVRTQYWHHITLSVLHRSTPRQKLRQWRQDLCPRQLCQLRTAVKILTVKLAKLLIVSSISMAASSFRSNWLLICLSKCL